MSDHYRRAEGLAKILARIDETSPGDLSPDVLAPLDQFHSGGLAATRDLANLAAIKPGEAVLDVGCGVGGPARVLAAEHGARVRAVDLSPAYVEIGRALSKKSGIAVIFEAANALDLPFADASFDLVWTQHASMNIADKPRLYRELRRVLRPEGRLAFHDLLVGAKPGPLQFPVPWADGAEESFLISAKDLRTLLASCGFRERIWQDRTAATLAYFEKMPPPTAPAPPLGIHLLLGPGFPAMAANIRRNMAEGRLGAAMAVYGAAPIGG
jgi:SAM-dependent methyltransferase